tara:strand:+ start:41349 stop:41630 length:282 start_codon:yes stop_codon:yes gene_type:complete
MFTKTDKALLDRAARHYTLAAAKLQATYGTASWGADKKCRTAKLEYDRLMRDAHDLRMLAQRLTKAAKAIGSTQAIMTYQTPAPVAPTPIQEQ